MLLGFQQEARRVLSVGVVVVVLLSFEENTVHTGHTGGVGGCWARNYKKVSSAHLWKTSVGATHTFCEP
jgi:hypothetical protein